MKIFVSEHGSGDRSGKSQNQEIAWDNGKGLEKAIDQAEPNTEIKLRRATYRLTRPINWKKSGRYSRPIRITGEGPEASGGEYGKSVLSVHDQWPKIIGDRTTHIGSKDAGNDFIHLQDGVEHIVIERLSLQNFARCFVAEGGHNEGIVIQSIWADTLRQFASILAKAEHNSSNDWHIRRCHLTGIARRAIRAEGLHDSDFIDIYADCQDHRGQTHSGDWPLLFHAQADAHDLRFERCCGANPHHPGSSDDNGDCFTTEDRTRRIRFTACIAYQPSDAGFDLKGKGHELQRCYVERAGNRAYRIWGESELHQCIAEAQGETKGDNAAIWVNNGTAIVSNFVGKDTERPIAVDGRGSVRITNSRFHLRRQLRDKGYSLRNNIKHDGSIKANNVKYQLD
ncbi:MAG: hypothetical protein AB8B99_09685 [Phormidesmis sp.]